MLQNTFLHIPGVGKVTERRLWEEGCSCWEDFLGDVTRYSMGTATRGAAKHHLEKSREALQNREHRFFRVGLGAQQAWRAYPEFKNSCLYLDIETDGGQGPGSITTIGLYDGKEYTCLIKGQDLDRFEEIFPQFQMVVTFFGGAFDLPVLQRRFPNVRFDQLHIDLCPTLRQVGYRGGLKKIEKQVGIRRGNGTEGMSGYDAVLLWRRYKNLRDERALQKLIAYNREDVVNLETLAEFAYRKLKWDAMRGPMPKEPQAATQ